MNHAGRGPRVRRPTTDAGAKDMGASAFREWLAKEQPLLAAPSADKVWPGMVEGMELAWNAACEAAARAQAPMLRSMQSRGEAADACRALKTEYSGRNV